MDRHTAWVNLDDLRRKCFLKHEFQKKLLRSIRKSKTALYWRRYYASYLTSKIPKSSSKVRAGNRCVVSGRTWSVSDKTQYNRFILRTEIAESNIPGCSRASW